MLFLRLLFKFLTCISAFLSISCTFWLSVLLKQTCAQCCCLRVSSQAFSQSQMVCLETGLPEALCICSTICFLSMRACILCLKQLWRQSEELSSTSTASCIPSCLPYTVGSAVKFSRQSADDGSGHPPLQSIAAEPRRRSQASRTPACSGCIPEELQLLILEGNGCTHTHHHHLDIINLPSDRPKHIQLNNNMLEAYSAEDTPIEVAFEDESSGLDNYESTQLLRLSLKARNSYLELHDPHKDLDFQQKLHLQVQVQSARDLIFQCNLELTDFITECRDSSNEDRTTNKQVGEDNPLELLTLSSKSSSDPSCWFRRLATTLEAFRKTLTLREVQLTMVLFIVEHREAPDFETLYFKNYGELMSFMVPPPLTSCPINVFILEDLFRKEAQHLKTYRAEIKRLKASLEFEEREQIKLSLGRMRISNSKIKTIGEVFPWACIKDQSDLFSVSPYDIRWQRLTSEGQIKHITLADKHTLSQSFDSIKHNITTVNAAMSILDRYQQHQKKPLPERLAHILFTAAKVIRIAIFESAAKQEAEIMMAEPQETLAKEIWNLPESKRFKVFIELSLPSIKYSELFYLPRQHRQYFYERYQDCRPADLPSVAIKDKKEYLRLLTSKRPYDETIRVRINCPFQLHLNREGQHSHKSAYEKTYQGIIRLFQRRGKIPKKLIFHIHGGGFISMSSFIHQTYTRTWADNLQVPIISVDYGKAPDRPFPQGLYDCFQSYMWALHQFQQIFQAFPETVVVVGDSAGGNLAAALVTLLISWDLPPPQGLVLVYPALNLNFKNYTPSLLSALNDMILPHTFLKLCLRAYLKDERFMSDKNPFVSPILTPRSILRRYPRTQILVGNKDPFHDDCCRLVESLNEESKGLANLTVLEEFPHGFLQFDLKLFPNEFSRQATTIVQEALASLLRL